MLLLAVTTIGSVMATDVEEERRRSTFGGGPSSPSAACCRRSRQPTLDRSVTAPAGGMGQDNCNCSTPLLQTQPSDDFSGRRDSHDSHYTDTQVKDAADEAIEQQQRRYTEEMMKTNCFVRGVMKVCDLMGNFFRDLPPVDEPIADALERCRMSRLSNFVRFAKPGSKIIYGGRQTFAVVGGLHTLVHVIQARLHDAPAWLDTCMANDSYFAWVNDPSKRHACSVAIDVAPAAVFLLTVFQSTQQNRGRYILPLFGCCGDWPAERQFMHFLHDERAATRRQIIRRQLLTYTDNTTLRINRLNDPCALMTIIMNAEYDHADEAIIKARASADELGIHDKDSRDAHIKEFMADHEKYNPINHDLFEHITDAAIRHMATAGLEPESLRKELDIVKNRVRERQNSFQATTRDGDAPGLRRKGTGEKRGNAVEDNEATYK